ALERAASLGDGAIAGAVRSLTLAMKDEVVAEEQEDHVKVVTLAETEAKPVLAKFFGEELFDKSKPLPRKLLELAEDVLNERKRTGDAATVRLAIRGEAINADDLARAIDRAFGAG